MITACILTRDSARTIRPCIEAVCPAVDEIVIVDTGSLDSTIDIVESLGLHVHHFEWIDDFAAARNFCLSLARTDWVIFVDSDEILRIEDVPNIRKAAAHGNNLPQPMIIGVIIENHIESAVQRQTNPRMFRREVGLHWMYAVHEQIRKMDGTEASSYTAPDIRFVHDGYDAKVVGFYNKALRNVRILKREIEKYPDDLGLRYFIGRDMINTTELDEAIEHLRMACELGKKYPNHSLRIGAHAALMKAYESYGRYDDAEREAIRMTELFPDHPDAFFHRSRLAMRRLNNELQSIERNIRKSKQLAQNYHGKYMVDDSLATWKTDIALGDVARYTGNIQTVRDMYRSAIHHNPALQNVRDALAALESQVLKLASDIQHEN